MTTAFASTSRRSRWLFFISCAVIAAVGAWFITGAQALMFVDTNDFQRVVGHLYLTPLGDGIRWALPERPFRIPGNPELASHVFTFAAWVQRFLPGSLFDLSRTALAAQCLLLVYACVLAWQCAKALQRGALWCTGLGLVWLAVFFMAHTIGMAQSFYAEYVFLIAAPLLLIGALASSPRVRLLCLCVGALACGLAKVQYFYVPLLVLASVWAASCWQRVAVDKRLLKSLLVIQIVCLVPLLIGKNGALNAHHGLYLGSYMALTPVQLDGLKVSEAERRCIGVDAWGNALTGPGGTVVHTGVPTCYPESPKLSKRDVLRPYLHYPQALWALAAGALPHHFTVHYFHVFPGNFYLKRTGNGAQPATNWLIRMTDWRNRVITPLAPVFVLAALVGLAVSRRSQAPGLQRLAVGGLLLALFFVSQIVITLLGEGVRDLSKHLWAAQMALDMLVPLVLLQAFSLGWHAWVRSRTHASAGVVELQK